MKKNKISQIVEETSYYEVEADGWPKPVAITESELPVEQFSLDLLPQQLRPYVEDTAERVSCPIDFVAVSIVVVLGSVIGTACGICPKARDNWVVTPNLWGVLVGPPTSGKTPAMDSAMRFLKVLKSESAKQKAKAQQQYLAEQAIYEAKKSSLEKQMKTLADQSAKEHKPLTKYKSVGAAKQVEKEIDIEEHKNNAWERLQQRYAELAAPQKLSFRKFDVNDITMEKLQEHMAENSHGILVSQDEIAGFIKRQDDPQNAAEKAFHLQAWNGLGSYELERIGRGTIFARRVCTSMLGGIQKAKLYPLVASTVYGSNNDGFLQRFQMAVMPDLAPWVNIDRYPDYAASEMVSNVIRNLTAIDKSFGSEIHDEDIAILRFSEDAQELFNAWINGLMNDKARTEPCTALGEHLAKYKKLMPALSLIFHLVHTVGEGAQTSEVCAECAGRAMDWCSYLESHARRIYGIVTNSQGAAMKLSEKLKAGSLPDGFTVRDVSEKDWQYLGNAERIEAACALLIENGWLKREESPPGSPGRPTVRFRINPQIRNKPS